MTDSAGLIFDDALLRSIPTAAYVARAPDGVIVAHNDLAEMLWGRIPSDAERDSQFFHAVEVGRGTPNVLSFRSPSMRLFEELKPQVGGSTYVTRADGAQLFVAYRSAMIPD